MKSEMVNYNLTGKDPAAAQLVYEIMSDMRPDNYCSNFVNFRIVKNEFMLGTKCSMLLERAGIYKNMICDELNIDEDDGSMYAIDVAFDAILEASTILSYQVAVYDDLDIFSWEKWKKAYRKMNSSTQAVRNDLIKLKAHDIYFQALDAVFKHYIEIVNIFKARAQEYGLYYKFINK